MARILLWVLAGFSKICNPGPRNAKLIVAVIAGLWAFFLAYFPVVCWLVFDWHLPFWVCVAFVPASLALGFIAALYFLAAMLPYDADDETVTKE